MSAGDKDDIGPGLGHVTPDCAIHRLLVAMADAQYAWRHWEYARRIYDEDKVLGGSAQASPQHLARLGERSNAVRAAGQTYEASRVGLGSAMREYLDQVEDGDAESQ